MQAFYQDGNQSSRGVSLYAILRAPPRPGTCRPALNMMSEKRQHQHGGKAEYEDALVMVSQKGCFCLKVREMPPDARLQEQDFLDAPETPQLHAAHPTAPF